MRIRSSSRPPSTIRNSRSLWRSADDPASEAVWNYDQFYGLVDNGKLTHEGWTTLAAMAVVIRNARGAAWSLG